MCCGRGLRLRHARSGGLAWWLCAHVCDAVASGPAATALEDSAELLRTMLESERDGQGGPAENGHAGLHQRNGASPPEDTHNDAPLAARQQGFRDR